MDETKLRALLGSLSSGQVTVDHVLKELKDLPFEDLGFAVVDHHRALRVGVPEVIWGQGKTPEHLVAIAQALLRKGPQVLVTRVSEEGAAALQALGSEHSVVHHVEARCVLIGEARAEAPIATVAVVSAGTSDRPVAEEARVTAAALNLHTVSIDDVGVAGLHRILSRVPELRATDAVIVVAGMEGALPTVVAGLIPQPVIAVPTSVGYGSSFEGLTALLGMLNSCSSGLSVVNIDNGFGAAMAAFRMLRKRGVEDGT